MFNSMKIKIIIPVITILVLLAIMTIISVSSATENLANSLSEERILGASQAAGAHLETLKSRTQAASDSMAVSLTLIELLQSGDRDELFYFLYSRRQALNVDGFIVADALGHIIIRTYDPDRYGDFTDMPCITAALQGRATTAYTSSHAIPMAMASTTPVYDEQNSIIAVISSYFVVSSYDFVDSFGETFNAQVTVFDGGFVAASTVLNVDGTRTTGLPVASPLVAEAVIVRGETYRTIITLYEVQHHAYYFPLRNAADEIIGMFFIGFSNEHALTSVVTLQRMLLIIGAASLVFSTVVMLIILTRVLKPLERLTRSVSSINDTSENVTIYGIGRTDEVGLLSQTIQNILRDISIAQAQEKKAHELNEVILTFAPFVIGLWGGDNNPIKVSSFAKELFGVKDPLEVAQRLYDFSPEFQPCGTPTPEKAAYYAQKAYKDGYVRFEWMHNAPTGGPMPVDVVNKCFIHNDEKMLVSYTMDLREVKAAQEEAKQREKLLNTVNQAAEVLLTANEEDIMNALMSAMEIVGHCVDADRVQIWRNEIIDGELHFVMRYEWLSEVGKQKVEVPIGLKFPYSGVPEWFDMFSQGQAINSPISQLSPRDAAFLGHYEMASIVNLPLFMNGEFIGFFSVDDCRYEKVYNEDEMRLFASVGLMCTSVFNKALQMQEREAHERERQTIELTQKLLDNSPIFMEYWDINGNMLDCNENLLNVLGVSSRDEFFRQFYDFSMPVQPCGRTSEELNNEMIRLAVEHGFSRSEWVFKLPNGESLPTETTWAHIRHRDKSMIIVYSLDSRPIKAAVEAEESNRAKSRFLARMSHEIRTPITAVMGISEVQLRGQIMPPHTEEAFSKIYDSSKILLNIVNDILDFSKIESGKMSLLEKEYDVASLAGDISQLHLVYLDNKNITFQMLVDENLPAKLVGDSLRIRQIINNLLTNAFKYTESGTVILSLHYDYGNLIISVKDTGMGMTAQQIKEVQGLNSEYVRLHEKEKPFVSGTGLGLPIVYSMVQIMNAEFDLQSEVSKGTNVTVKIPQKTVDSEILGSELATKLQNFESGTWSSAKVFEFVPEQMPYGSVLVVDDVDTNLYVAEAMLEAFGLNIEMVESGQAAIDKIVQGNVYDVIFLDHMMPGMDGIEVVKKLRNMGYNHPIVALTANAIKGQAEMFMNNGFSGFMSKPIDIKILNSYLVRFVKK